jgi:uncharacterized protein DUF3489
MTTTATAVAAIKLSDTQLVILSGAAQHPERAVAIPERIKGGAVQRVVGALLAKGLVEAIPHREDMPVYKTEVDGSRVALLITDAGLLALGIEPDAPAADEVPVAEAETAKTGGKPARTRQPRSGTKQEMLIAMLKRPEGATLPEVVEATGWLPHTVRGAIVGALKKRLGLTVTSEPIDDRGRVYRIEG